MFRFLLFVLLALAASVASSQSYRAPPDDGFWWNPAEPGRGWSIETQGEFTAVLHYVYAPNRAATFQQSVGTWDAVNRRLVTSLDGLSGGQCPGCAYTAPTVTSLGEVRFEFSSEMRGQIRYANGSTTPIERFEYGYADNVDKLMGGWSTAWTSTSGIISSAHFIYFSGRCANCAQPTAEGRTKRANSGRASLMGPSAGIYVGIVDATTSFYDYYYVSVTTEKMSGLACTGRKTDPPPTITGCAGLIDGLRVYSLAHARSVFGATKDAVASDQDETSRDAEAQRAKMASPVADHVIDRAAKLYEASAAADTDMLTLYRSMRGME